MTSSVIPARLEFQCGHAALVSLPRIKGESSAQRNERVTREKAAAQARSCDFCGPDVAIVVQATEPETVAVESAAEVLADLEAVAEAVAAVAAEAEAAEQAELVEAGFVEEAPIEAVVVEATVVLDDEPEPVIVVEAAREPISVVEEVVATEAVSAPVTRTRVPRAPRKLVQDALKQFTVQYRVEQVISASDIADALRRVGELGATDVLAISRE